MSLAWSGEVTGAKGTTESLPEGISSARSIMESLRAVLRMRQDIEQRISDLGRPLECLISAETTDDIQKYLRDFLTEFNKLSKAGASLAGFTILALSKDLELLERDQFRAQIASLWEVYGRLKQIECTCTLCHALEDDALRRGLEYIEEQICDLQVVCEEGTAQLKGDLEMSESAN
ncbi:predicted protein [Histoplasma mississippiense (nom. inval.)]|uniref:predicted protein n=1 Tax=Ajellomyces capsulatus (strain NAm1 / WU24) TaxID=2059318 RepID=UPI000157D56D|nr:predicted protein [Histoplasma mississippiense (nom. inval.)]EDN05429.1 predicted protein [Histoplasma mississippiense (nom. inval.)]